MSYLNLDLAEAELNKAYREDYYWYLKSPEFKSTFLSKIGSLVGTKSVLDVGCGEGQLSEFTRGPYLGIDASEVAIRNATEKYCPDFVTKEFRVARIESFPSYAYYKPIDIIVFGGLLSVLIKPEKRLDFIRDYLTSFKPSQFVVYDLANLDLDPIRKEYKPYVTYRDTVDLPSLQEIKRTRIIEAYSCD